jgi:very-short-patch-repair endonuclease
VPPSDAAVAQLARRQIGVVTAAQLRACGLSRAAIAARAKDGRLQRLHRGVYAVAHRSLPPEAFWLAAVLACGPQAALSHRSAATAWELRHDGSRSFDVTSPRAGGKAKSGITAHRSNLDRADVTTHRGVPITTPARTLLDLAEVVPRAQLDRALEEAFRCRLTHRAALEATLARANGRRGVKPLQAALDSMHPLAPRTKSAFERRALALIAQHDLPRPLVNVHVAGLEVDLFWPAHKLVVELDSLEFHFTRPAFERDRRKDAILGRAGYAVQRFTWRQLDDEFLATLAELLSRRAAPAAAAAPGGRPPGRGRH